MSDMVVAQLHRALVDAIRRTRPDAVDRSVTVAEIYQDLIPYRTARANIGFEMNADYEHALLRLLAGEGDLARIEPREVRDKLRIELESANPDVGLYRNYAACDVWVNIDAETPDEIDTLFDEPGSWLDDFIGPDGSSSEPASQPAAVAQPHAAAEETAAEFEEPKPQPVPHAPAKPPFQMAAEAKSQSQQMQNEPDSADCCLVCGGELPPGRIVNFCPYCGTDQSQKPCPTCGEMLDPLWRFCVACGTRVRAAGDDVN